MILDHASGDCPTQWEADVVIVGAGAAGLALAVELSSTALRVFVLESGGWDDEPATQDLYRTTDLGLPFQSAMTGRFRIFGGSTTKWGGQSLPLFPIDFAHREWVANSGWPLSYNDVSPYFDRANRFLDVDTLDYRIGLGEKLGVCPPDLATSGAEYHFSKWAREPNLRAVYRQSLQNSKSIHVVLHANLTKLHREDSQLTSVAYSTLTGRVGEVRAKNVVLATGALEVARVLLNDREFATKFEHVLGRYLQDHPATRLGHVETKSSRRLQFYFNGRRWNGRKYTSRLSVNEATQKRLQLLNASAAFLFTLPETSGLSIAREIAKGGTSASRAIRQPMEMARILPSVCLTAATYFFQHRVYFPGALCEVAASFEQEPDPASRVLLSDEVDALGMRRLIVDWRIGRNTFETAREFCIVIDESLKHLEVGRLVSPSWLASTNPSDPPDRCFGDQNHHMGTTRMSHSSATGVVDTTMRVHGMANLYIASSSVFPTGGHSNPTLTLLALCMRLADHLRRTHDETTIHRLSEAVPRAQADS
jgi:choline dehydrogenase-like flavoprotein